MSPAYQPDGSGTVAPAACAAGDDAIAVRVEITSAGLASTARTRKARLLDDERDIVVPP
jgi:hypothetical protein